VKNPLHRMPWGLRVGFGVFVSGVFAFVGASFWASSRPVAWVLFALAALRLVSAGRMAAWYLTADPGEPDPGVAWDEVQKELDG
jgi:hypothetical protein